MKTPTQILTDACAVATIPRRDVLACHKNPRMVGIRAAVASIARGYGWKWHAISAALGMERTMSYKAERRYAERLLTPTALAQADAIVAAIGRTKP